MAYYGYKPAEQAIQIGDNTIVSADIADGSIVNADLNSSAAIAMSKTQLTAGTGITLSTNTLNVDAAQTQITSVGTIGTGVWQGTAVASAYLDADTAHLSGTQTFSGAKTFSAAASFSANVGFTANVSLNDNDLLQLGSGDDLRLYHDGSNSYIKSTTGWLNMPIGGSGVSIANSDFSESIARFLVDGACELYHNGTKRIETTSSGISVTDDATFAGQVKIDTTQRYMTKWESTYGTDRDYWWRNDGGTLQLGEGAEGDSQVLACFDTAQKRLGLGTRSPQTTFHVSSSADTFHRTDAGSSSGIQYQLFHGGTQTATINSNTTNIFSVYDGSAGGTNVFNIADGGTATFSNDVFIASSGLQMGSDSDWRVRHYSKHYEVTADPHTFGTLSLGAYTSAVVTIEVAGTNSNDGMWAAKRCLIYQRSGGNLELADTAVSYDLNTGGASFDTSISGGDVTFKIDRVAGDDLQYTVYIRVVPGGYGSVSFSLV